ncbi:Protein of unknown function [Oceanospirillum multiglobuliferum]|uniref:Terminase n=1 Tax=Oceanospirillum multiglobuliferum TaxID=64969 RepID=A0A1T4QYR5_9GAMM|nr:DUF3486 family protein [Oceanospirillum multiglobuliferum]OPX57061.1 hypothetical protein BTE48_01120 [Oceanospirillum multiglobuliferum]SKA08727.1 Protein of unknown function [Oceanospirillum multiglobuliferum]
MTDRKQKRGRRSKVQLLPEELKAQLDAMLRDGRLQQIEILDLINQRIEDQGLAEDDKLTRSGLSRYASRMEAAAARIRQGREIAEVWTAKLGDKPTSDAGKLLREAVTTMAFETSAHMLNTSDESTPVEPKVLGQLALVSQRIEQASMMGIKREKEIRKAFAEEAANAVSEELRGQDGMSEQLEARIRKVLLGKA